MVQLFGRRGCNIGKIIWVEGLVGCGKSTLAQYMADKTNAKYIKEPVDDNEYLEDFYNDMTRWGFSMQMELLHRRFKQHYDAENDDAGVLVFDRGILGDRVFADMLNEDGHITDREYRTYLNAHNIMTDVISSPDLIVWLRVKPETAYDRIIKRNRSQEQSGIPVEYLENMLHHYRKLFFNATEKNKHLFVQDVPVLSVDWDVPKTEQLMEEITFKAIDIINTQE